MIDQLLSYWADKKLRQANEELAGELDSARQLAEEWRQDYGRSNDENTKSRWRIRDLERELGEAGCIAHLTAYETVLVQRNRIFEIVYRAMGKDLPTDGVDGTITAFEKWLGARVPLPSLEEWSKAMNR